MIIFVQHLTVELLFYSNEYVEVLCDINAFLDAHKLQVVSKSNSANDGPSIDINSSWLMIMLLNSLHADGLYKSHWRAP
jgi:hypothetical protein